MALTRAQDPSRTLAYVTVNETLSAVVESQLLTPASYLPTSWPKVWYAVTAVGQLVRPRWRERVLETRRRAQSRYGVELQVIPAPPSRLGRCPGLDAWHARQIARRLSSLEGALVVQGRGERAAGLAQDAARRIGARARSVFDCRGDGPYEEAARHVADLGDPAAWPLHVQRGFERVSGAVDRAVGCDSIVCVSQHLADVLVTRHRAERSRITVIPCGIDPERFSGSSRELARSRLGLADSFVVAYVGSLEWYQLPDQSLRLFRLIAEQVPQARFLALTGSPDRMRKAIQAAGLRGDRTTVLSLAPADVPASLAAADLGLMPRARNPVNAVASPLKMAEYMAAGVPVVTTPWVGDYSTMVEELDVGVCVDLERPDDDAARRMSRVLHGGAEEAESRRVRCRRLAEELSWPTLRRRLEGVYLQPADA